MSFQWATETEAACVGYLWMFSPVAPHILHISHFFVVVVVARGAFGLGRLWMGNWISCPRDFLTHPLTRSIIFQEVFLFVWGWGWVGRGGGVLHISCCRIVWWSRCSEPVAQSRPRFSRASCSSRAGLWSLLFWQHFRLYPSLSRCVPVCSPDLLKVRGKMYFAFVYYRQDLWAKVGTRFVP